MSLATLPTELLQIICESIPAFEAYQLAGLARTNRRLHAIVTFYLYTTGKIIEATWYATRYDKVHCLFKAMQEKARREPDSRGKPFHSSLVTACRRGSINVAQLIVQQFPEMLDQDTEGEMCIHPLAAAATTGQFEIVSWLLRIPRVDPNRRDGIFRTPLMWACFSGHTNAVDRLLMRHDIGVNDRGLDRMTPLEIAYDNDRIEVMRTLLRDSRLNLADCSANILELAVQQFNHRAVRCILSYYEPQYLIWNEWTYTALRTAFARGITDMIGNFAAVPGLDINATPSRGLPNERLFPPLLWVALRRPGGMWRYLFEFPNLDVNIRYPGVDGTPLVAAVRARRNTLATMLIDHGSLLNEQDDSRGFTALMWAVTRGNEEMVRLLLSKAAIDLSVKDREGIPVLCHATAGRDYDIMKLLLDHPQVDVNIFNNDGMTPLMLSVKHRRYGMAHLLVEKGGIDYNLQDNDGKTVSDHASIGQTRQRFAVLIRAGMRNRVLPRRPARAASMIARMSTN